MAEKLGGAWTLRTKRHSVEGVERLGEGRWGWPLSEIEIVYVTVSRKDARDHVPKRRALPYERGDPLPRLGESVIIDFEAGSPTRWIVQDVAHVIDSERRGIVVKLAAPFAP